MAAVPNAGRSDVAASSADPTRAAEKVAEAAMSAVTVQDRKKVLKSSIGTKNTAVHDHMEKNTSLACNPTELARAAGAGKLDDMVAILDGGVDVNGETEFGGSALVFAASKGKLSAVKFLLERGADPTASTKGGRSALHAAAEKNMGKTVEALVEAGAKLEAIDRDGCTPLIVAAAADAHKGVAALAAAGANLEATDSSEHADTALLAAARLGCVKAARVLCEAGADFYKTGKDSSRAFDAARQCTSAKKSAKMYDLLLEVSLDREDEDEDDSD